MWCGVLQEETALPKADGDWALGVEGLAVGMEDTQGMDMTQAGDCVRGMRSVGGRHLESQHEGDAKGNQEGLEVRECGDLEA